MPSPVATSFGSFCLIPSQRLLLEDGAAVRVGGRAIDLLIALVERAGEVVAKEALLARVWPSTVVDDASLRVHVATLRKVLGDGHGGQRFIATVPGRGYSFVAALSAAGSLDQPSPPRGTRPQGLPTSLVRMIGQHQAVEAIRAVLADRRLVTVVGPGGIGKTSAALVVAERSLHRFEAGVHVVDLAVIPEPARVVAAIAQAIGAATDDAGDAAGLAAHLRDGECLLILDNCDQVVDEAAVIAVQMLKSAPGLRVLATSREPLRAEGEVVQRLPSLPVPPRGEVQSTAARAMAWPAVELLVERARASQDGFELSDADAEFAAEICRRLDGMPLAIELAAVRIGFFGMQGLLAHLDDSLRILSSGHRTALPRHQTLRALIDWSFDLLSPTAQAVLRRLSVFAGPFSLDAAAAVVADEHLPSTAVLESVLDLSLKSLIATDHGGEVLRYRLLETTRAYAADKLARSDESQEVLERHVAWRARHVDERAVDAARRAMPPSHATPRHRATETICLLDGSIGPAGDPLPGGGGGGEASGLRESGPAGDVAGGLDGDPGDNPDALGGRGLPRELEAAP